MFFERKKKATKLALAFLTVKGINYKTIPISCLDLQMSQRWTVQPVALVKSKPSPWTCCPVEPKGTLPQMFIGTSRGNLWTLLYLWPDISQEDTEQTLSTQSPQAQPRLISQLNVSCMFLLFKVLSIFLFYIIGKLKKKAFGHNCYKY